MKRSSIGDKWLLVAGCFLVTLCHGEVMMSFGVFFKAFEVDFGWSRGAISSVYTFLTCALAVSAIVAGKYSDRNHARLVLLASAVVGSTAIVFCGEIQSLNQLRGVVIGAGLGAGAAVPVPASIVQRTFRNQSHSGLALSVVSAGVGAGGFISAPVLNHIILHFGWRTAFLVAGVLFGVLIITGTALIARAGGFRFLRCECLTRPSEQVPRQSPTRLVVLSRGYLAVLLVNVLGLIAITVVNAHLIPLATDRGISLTTAALALSLVSGMSVLGRLGCGLISDAIGWRSTLAVAISGGGIAVMLLPWAGQAWVVFLLVVVFGVCHGARAVAALGMVGTMFGMRAVGELLGLMVSVSLLAGSIGPYVAGMVYDYTNSYHIVLAILGLALISSGVAAARLLASAPAHADNRSGTA
ncbi:MFS transporter [Chloroflexota bacterium]